MFTLALSLVLSAAVAEPAEPAATPPTTEQTAKPVKPKRVCRRITMTGSHLGRRICKTKDQWLAADTSAPIDTINQGYKQNEGVGASPLGGG